MKYLSYIKWILMLLGAMRYRIYGAFMGFFVGYFIEEFFKNYIFEIQPRDPKTGFKKVNHFTITPYQKNLCILITEVLKADNYIPKEQSHYILKYFYRQFGKEQGNNLFNFIRDIIKNENDVDAAAIFLKGHTNRNGRIHIIQFLYGLSIVDNQFIEPEQKLLKKIAVRIGMIKEDYENIVRQFKKKEEKTYYHNYINNRPTASYYEVLGIRETDGETEIKKAYRKLVLVYHPDRTKLDKKTAAQKFQEVQEAFDRIKEIKGFK